MLILAFCFFLLFFVLFNQGFIGCVKVSDDLFVIAVYVKKLQHLFFGLPVLFLLHQVADNVKFSHIVGRMLLQNLFPQSGRCLLLTQGPFAHTAVKLHVAVFPIMLQKILHNPYRLFSSRRLLKGHPLWHLGSGALHQGIEYPQHLHILIGMVDAKGLQSFQLLPALFYLSLVDQAFYPQVIADICVRIHPLLVQDLKKGIIDKFFVLNVIRHIV